MDHPVPIPNAYWVEPGRLLAGEYPGDAVEERARERLKRFLDAGVRCFIDLTEEVDGLEPYVPILEREALDRGVPVEHVPMPIPDISVPSSREDMTRILDTIEYALARERVVYVHCWGGAGRTGTVVGCYLVRQGLSGESALDGVAERWRTVGKYWRSKDSPQTEEQRAWVLRWAEQEGAAPAGS